MLCCQVCSNSLTLQLFTSASSLVTSLPTGLWASILAARHREGGSARTGAPQNGPRAPKGFHLNAGRRGKDPLSSCPDSDVSGSSRSAAWKVSNLKWLCPGATYLHYTFISHSGDPGVLNATLLKRRLSSISRVQILTVSSKSVSLKLWGSFPRLPGCVTVVASGNPQVSHHFYWDNTGTTQKVNDELLT